MQPGIVSPRPPLLLGLAAAVAAAAFAVGGAGGYALYEHRKAEAAIQGQQQLAAELQQTRAQIGQLSTKVDELAARPQVVAPSPIPEPAVARKPATPRGPSEGQRLKKMQSQLDRQGNAIDQQGKAIADTQSQLDVTKDDLSNTRTELSGSIARTHDELVLLQKKGERNYYEFDIAKSKSFQHEGPLGVRLRKANSKHQYADLDLIVEDKTVAQKHVNLYQPAMFFTPDSPQPAELVINSIGKDRIHGYVSSPKYRQSQLASASNESGSSAAQTPSSQVASQPQQQRQSLPQPQ
jgi:transcriptional regulator with PAS, ATPase and Fis domain